MIQFHLGRNAALGTTHVTRHYALFGSRQDFLVDKNGHRACGLGVSSNSGN